MLKLIETGPHTNQGAKIWRSHKKVKAQVYTPAEFRKNYQYYTEANIQKLRSIGYTSNFFSLEDGITDYIQNYLKEKRYY